MSSINHANAISKVRVVVVGDSGVGKSSFVYLASHGEPLRKASWTIGCGVEVRLHEFREGTSSQRTYFIELWDIGGNNSHKNARHVFFNPVHGIILIHDLTNRKSQQNLNSWLGEVLLRESESSLSGPRMPLVDGFDAEQFGGFSQIPVFVVGTRLHQIKDHRSSGRLRTSSIAEKCGADEIFIDCLDKRALAPGSSNSVKLSRFFDKVIEKQLLVANKIEAAASGYSYTERENNTATLRRSKSNSGINFPHKS